MNKSEEIEKTVNHLRFDFRAEVVIGDLIEKGLERDEFIVKPHGKFKRKYSRDIDHADTLKLNNGQELIEICISRDAIYDTLPEGLFHQKNETIIKEQKNVSRDSKRLKAEEKAARIFFLPFENELLLQGINLELEERRILSRFSENLFDDISSKFWSLDQSLSRHYLSMMVKFLHISHKISGNEKRIANCLEAILNEKVTVSILDNNDEVQVKGKDNKAIHECCLGMANLGIDFVCGDSFNTMDRSICFDIGPLKNSNICDYLENGKVTSFLRCFFDYFVPVELEVKINIRVPVEKQNFCLQSHGEGAVLGYLTAI